MEGTKFCPECGFEVDKDVGMKIKSQNEQLFSNVKKKKIISILILSITAFLIIIFIIFNLYKIANAKNIEQYKIDAAIFSDEVISDGSLLEDTGNDICTNWHSFIYSNGYLSLDSAIDSAKKAHADDLYDVRVNYDKKTTKYVNLMKLPAETEELKEIKSNVKEIYDAYVDLYDCVTSVNGNYSTFSEKFINDIDALNQAHNKLDVLLR
jgi:hypothetical protein